MNWQAERPALEVVGVLSRALERENPKGLVSAYLFGSWASGRPHRESDVDVGVLLRHESIRSRRERFEERVRLGSWLIGELGVNDVDVVILNDAPPYLARKIVLDGKRVFLAAAAVDYAFVRDVQLSAADSEPFLRRTRARKLGAIAR